MVNSQPHHLLLAILLIGFISNPIFDFLSIYLSSSDATHVRVSLLTRGVFIAAIIVATFLLAVPQKKSNAIMLMILSLPLVSVAIWCVLDFYSVMVLLETTAYLVKVISFFAFLMAFKFINKAQQKTAEKVIIITLFVYMLCVVFGALFSIEIFESYSTIERFGYKGIIIAQNEATGLVLAALLISGYKFVMGESNGYDKLLFSLTSIAAVMLGTKAGVALPILTLAAILIAQKGYIAAVPKVLIAASFFVMVSVLVFVYIPSANEALTKSLSYFVFQYENYAKGNLFTLLLSGRDNKLEFAITEYLFQNPFYLILGGYPLGSYAVELDFVDIALLFGLPIFLIYLKGIYFAFSNKSTARLNRFYFMSFVLVVLVSNTSGHVFTSALTLPYLAFFCSLDNFDHKIKFIKENTNV